MKSVQRARAIPAFHTERLNLFKECFQPQISGEVGVKGGGSLNKAGRDSVERRKIEQEAVQEEEEEEPEEEQEEEGSARGRPQPKGKSKGKRKAK